jgi:hypothetical protein
MREKFLNLYLSNKKIIDDIKISLKNENFHGPFLMSPTENHFKTNPKIMFIGKETFGWENYDDINESLDLYEDFNLGVYYYSTPFWNVIRKIEKKITNSTYNSFWTNLNRFDVNKTSPSGNNLTNISKLDFLVTKEIELIKPDYCIFFTSYSYDWRLESIFEGIKFIEVEGFQKKILCRLNHPFLPENSFRTYHPKYLRIKKFEESVINALF